MTPGARLYHLPLPCFRVALGDKRISLEGFATGTSHDTYGCGVIAIVGNDTSSRGDLRVRPVVMSWPGHRDSDHRSRLLTWDRYSGPEV